MAVMATETPINPVNLPEKAPLLSDTQPAAAGSEVNGNANHYDALFDESAPQNGIKHATEDTMSKQEPEKSKEVTAEDESTAPVDHVESGISGISAFLPAASGADAAPTATEPAPTSTTEPPPVEPSVSDVRDEPLPDEPLPANPAEAIADLDPAPIDAPMPSAPEASPPAAALQTPAEDKMDTSGDSPAPAPAEEPTTGEAQMADDPMPTVEPSLSEVVSTIPPPVETTPSQETVVTGQVRQREEDDEGERTPKRAKTESADEEAPAPPAPVATQVKTEAEAPAPTQPMDTDAKVPTPAPAAAAAPATPAIPTPSATQTPPVGLTPVALDSNPITPVQSRFLLEQVRKAKKTKSAIAFLKPVDPVALNIPNYRDVIKYPMDLSTMEEKLKTSQYANADEMMSDFNQMVQNSVTFNGANHAVALAGLNLQAYFVKCVKMMPKGQAAKAAEEKPKKAEPAPPKPARPARTATTVTAKSPVDNKPAGFLNEHGMPIIRRDSTAQHDRPKREIHPPKRDLPSSTARPKKKKAQLELKFCEKILGIMNQKKYTMFTYPFLIPVDPVALNIPNYHRVIKKPMDFGTMQTNLKNGQYANAKEFYNDAKLVFANCYKFNPPTDEVSKMGKSSEALFDQEWAKKDEWIADNMPPSEPASEDEAEEEEEEEEEEDTSQFRRMQEIQAQIAALSAEAMSLTSGGPKRASPKIGTKKGAKSGGVKVKTTKPAAAPKAAAKQKAKPKPKKLSLDQKREVSDGIAGLDEVKMRRAVQIIRNGVPALANVQDDELELDIDEIPDDVVYKLYEFVRSSLPKKEREPSPEYDMDDDDDYTAAKSNAGPRRKNKPMKAQEQEDRIKQLTDQLHGGNGDSGNSASPAAQHEQDSDDDASEESEEE